MCWDISIQNRDAAPVFIAVHQSGFMAMNMGVW